ncbi:glycosyltransferase [Candidatus Woesearchaeota archaeon]|nr:glycosyltransferase [Candidatus Woesearchaeota archaeon]
MIKMFRLAFLAPEFIPTWGGVGIYSVELIRELSKKKDLEIHVITPKRGKNYSKKRVLRYFDDKINIHNVSTANDTFFYNFKFQLALVKEFPKLHNKYRFDLVHSANLVHMPDIFLKLFGQLDIPTVCTIHTTIDSQSRLYGKKKLKLIKNREKVEILSRLTYPYINYMQKQNIKRTDRFIAVSEYTKNLVPGLKNCRVIHNGVDLKKFQKDSNDVLDFLDDIKMPKVLFAGRLLSMKGLDTYIRSIRRILKRKKAYFIFAGTGDVKKWERRLRGVLKKYYRFLGYVRHTDMPALYRKSDIFVLPSLTESFPLTVLEAMASKTPVIATDVGGIPEIISHEKNGILVKPLCHKGLADSILRLLDDLKLRKNISNNGFETVNDNFTTNKMADKTYEVYEEMLN